MIKPYCLLQSFDWDRDLKSLDSLVSFKMAAPILSSKDKNYQHLDWFLAKLFDFKRNKSNVGVNITSVSIGRGTES